MNTALTNGNISDGNYYLFLAEMGADFQGLVARHPLFMTDAEPGELWAAYLESFAEAERQHHNCHACRHFLQRFGGLVIIDPVTGRTQPAIFAFNKPGSGYETAFFDLSRVTSRAKVTGVFLSSVATLGTPVTGSWRHLSVTLPPAALHKYSVATAEQKMAERRQDFAQVARALAEFKEEHIDVALRLLESDALYRAEKVIGPARWLKRLHVDMAKAFNKKNILWLAVAQAPAGFCHPRSSMIGTLLEDIAEGQSFEQVSRAFSAKMHPLQYQRPSAPPAEGALAQAEKLVAQLGVAASLKRRYLRLDEVQAFWRPTPPEKKAPDEAVFGHLRRPAKTQTMRIPATTMTWEKFQKSALLDAVKIEFFVHARDNYTALVTADDPNAPPILQWDRPELRNPVSWYVWSGGSSPAEFNLQASGWVAVTAATLHPCHWHGNPAPSFGQGVILLLEGARDTKGRFAGSGLFPEIMKSEFHGVRSVIEAHSRAQPIEGAEESSACGIVLSKGGIWNNCRIRVNDDREYQLDRWD